ncbi:MAG: isocitrate lyase/phosphoenolpyruvate mutase family protein [Solirubrobacterales bacterium]
MGALADDFHALHRPGDPLRLLNAWDGGSARVLESAGAKAIGTTSAGAAFSLGLPDGQTITRQQLIANIAMIASRVSVPVTADIESGFGARAGDVADTVRSVITAGAVGINLEDVLAGGRNELMPLEDAAARVAAARDSADAEGVRLFVNARTDVFLRGVGDESTRLERTLERLAAYTEAGADGVFVPGVQDGRTLALLIQGADLPFNALAGPAGLTLEDYSVLGAARVSTGSVPSRAALGLAKDLALEFLNEGTLNAAAHGIPYADLNELLSD